MTRLSIIPALWLALALVPPPVADAQQDAPTRSVQLAAYGGVLFDAPTWKEARADASVVVLQRSPDRAKGVAFGVLVFTIEEGPARADAVDWKQVLDNIVGAAQESGSELSLSLGDPWERSTGFEGRRLTGTLKANEREVAVHMVALARDGALITVSALGPKDDAGVVTRLDTVATSAKSVSTP